MFERLVWQKGRMLLDDLVFWIEYEKNEIEKSDEEGFMFYKNKHLVDQYERFWLEQKPFNAQHIFELGIWDGGSLAFWFEYFQPKKHVGVDLSQQGDSPYFQQYVTSKGLESRIQTCWGINQADSEKLQQLVMQECSGVLDLVLDDASHMYEATKMSFEILFPFLRPGGLYIIEDWGWEHWPEFQKPDHPWRDEISLTKLICELVEVTGTPVLPGGKPTALISRLTVRQGFTVIERGEMGAEELQDFKIEQYISRRPQKTKLQRLLRNFKQKIS